MIPELGQFCLALAFTLALIQSIVPLIGAHQGNQRLMKVGLTAATGQLVFVALAFAMLTWSFVIQDFSVAYVMSNSNLLLPMPYRFSAVWGAHEGSLLLWTLILALWTGAVAAFHRTLPDTFGARVIAVLGMISLAFLAFMIFTSNPFLRHLPALADGRDLNPLLQDPGLIIHPPMLYTGYVGFAVAYAFAVAALLEGRIDSRWVRWSRPWTNVAWAFLTLGIGLGSWWAYYELGWGGWWFWDPVENASFMPWLVGTALIHSQAVTEKRGSFKNWTMLLSITAFCLSLLGTFIVRSGVLTSVHAFATDPTRGMFILGILTFFAAGALILFAIRAPKLPSGAPFSFWSRESALLINNLFMSLAAATVLLGTIFPLLSELLGWGKLSIGAPWFGPWFSALMVPVIIFMAVAPFVRWREHSAAETLKHALPHAVIAILIAALLVFGLDNLGMRGLAGIAGVVWVASLTIRYWINRASSAGRTPLGVFGMMIAHLGVAAFVLGVTFVETRGVETDLAAKPGDTMEVAGYRFEFVSITHPQGPNFRADEGHFKVFEGDQLITELFPQKRLYSGGGQIMTEAAIEDGITRDIYLSLGEPLDENGDAWAVRIYVKPFVRWIWGGALMMMFGGLLGALDRRYRRDRAPATSSMATDGAVVS